MHPPFYKKALERGLFVFVDLHFFNVIPTI